MTNVACRRSFLSASRIQTAALLVLMLPTGCLASPTLLGGSRADALIAAARDGTTVELPAGEYGDVTIAGRDHAQPVTIDARQAHFTKISFRKSSGFTLLGGTLTGPGGRSYGIWIQESHDIEVRSMTITGAHRGVVIDRSQSVTLDSNKLVGLISDGIDIGSSQKIHISSNICRDFNPTPATYAPDGKLLVDGDHPDCIQAWSRPQFPISADFTIVNNDISGQMQGIFLGNHVRNGVDDGGFDRVIIRNNKVTAGLPNGIYASGVRSGEIIDNVVDTVAGARLPKGKRGPVRAKLYIQGVNIRACGNRVSAVPNMPGTGPC